MNGNLYMIEALWDDFLRCKLLLFKVLVPNDLNNDFIALTFESIEFVALTHEFTSSTKTNLKKKKSFPIETEN